MLSVTVALLALAPQVLSLDAASGDDDSPWGLQFTPDGRGLVVQHDLEGAPCALTYIDLALGRVTARSPAFGEAHSFRVTPDGTRALLAEEFGPMRVLSLPGLQLLGSIPSTSHGEHRRIAVNAAGTLAVVRDEHNVRRFIVIDLVQLQEVRVFVANLSTPNYGSNYGMGFALDGVTLVVADQQALVAHDVQTGLETARVPYSSSGDATCIAFSGDGARCTVHICDSASPNAPNWIERFSLATLASQGVVQVATTRGLGPTYFDLPALDRPGDRMLLKASRGFALVDVATGAVTDHAGASEAALSPDGVHVVAGGDATTIVSDASGTVLATFPSVASDGSVLRVVASPTGRAFATLHSGLERVQVYDVSGASPMRVLDVSSGFGSEGDGPFELAFDATGRRVFAVARDSDELCIVDVDGPPVLMGRVPVDRQPLGVAPRADGRVLVTHGRGRSLSVVDPVALVELTRFPLPEHAWSVRAEPAGDRAWVELEGVTSRELAQVDTASGAVLRVVPLPGGAEYSSVGEVRAALVFDFARGQAFAAIPETGDVVRIDLATGATTLAPPTPVAAFQASLALRSDGALLVHHAGGGFARAFDVAAGGLVPRWQWSCASAPPTPWLRSSCTFVDGESAVLLPQAGGGATCPISVLLDAASGAPIATPSFWDNTWGVALDREVWLGRPHDFYADRFRVEGATTTYLGAVSTLHRSTVPLVHPHTRIAVCASGDFAHFDTFARIDALQETTSCVPPAPNATGQRASLRVDGSSFAGGLLVIVESGLQPFGMPGYLLVGSALSAPYPLPVGPGVLCLGGTLGRFVQQVQFADAAGRQRFTVDTGALPTALGPVGVQPGSSWTFQAWYRDQAPSGAAASNTSDAVTVQFL